MQWNLQEAMGYYRSQGAPGDQSALTGLLKEIQKEQGAVPMHMVTEIAQSYGIKAALLLALIKRIPSLRLADTHCLEICCGPNCPKRRDLTSFVEKTWGTKPSNFTVKHVPCMRQCGKGPNIRWDGTLYNGADEALLRKLIEKK